MTNIASNHKSQGDIIDGAPVRRRRTIEDWTDEEFIKASEWLASLPFNSTQDPYSEENTFPKIDFILKAYNPMMLFHSGRAGN